MKRTSEKIKDLVEPQTYDEVQNFAVDPARALAAYRFTDATSDLLARWLDALADLPRGRGTARALAGLRGVGKSHTLAAFNALVASAELRASITDAHVASSARRLMDRRYMVVRIERGTRTTLREEIAAALTATFGGDEAQWGSDPSAMLAIAASRAYDTTLVAIIDTAYGRDMRVRRDDGPVLSQLAVTTQNANAFLALALDDDIEGAEGVNAVLAQTYQIDYLDPDHLYHVADLYLLRKNPPARALLHELYLSLRADVPGFNWSEPRFVALYPVHPLIADISASVRLYAPTFAFLPFAVAAAVRATGRPASSLILLDEVFDHAEYDLRRAEDLRDAFAIYDELATTAVAQFPAMQRLQAKLLLKALFILSLDGRGATARELCAALLLHTEVVTGGSAIARIEEMLARFAEAAPPGAVQKSVENGETRHRLQISTSNDFESMLAASVERLPVDTAAMDEMLRVAARARFDDWPLADEREGAAMAAELHLVWRGSARFGRFIWHSPEALQPAPGAEVDSFHYDWEIVALVPGARAVPAQNSRTAADGETDHTKISVRWQPDHLTAEEANVLRRLIALRTDTALAAQFGEMARAAANSLSAQAERLWARIYLDSGTLITEGGALTLTEEARSASTLAATLSLSLTPLFDKHYPEHPHFTELLGEQQVAQLTEALFGRANAAAVDTQQLIRLFAVPLGLADLRGELYTFNTGSEEAEPGWIRQVLELTEQAKGAVVPLEAISRALRREPYGLQREAQHLILAALVAQRRLELTTAEGGRLGRRALDGTIDWENITGVCRAATVNYNPEALTAWARLLTNYMSLGSIADPVAREIVRAKLAEWLMDWNSRRLFEEFDQLPDAWLTTRVWNMAAATRKSFGAAADALKATLEDTLSLEEGLQRVSEAFADSPEQFSRLSTYLGELTEFISGLGKREQARAYIATAEPTGIEEIESARRQLWAMLDDPHRLLSSVSGNGFGPLWQTFHARYAEHYAAMHDKAVGQGRDRKALDALLRSARWREFEALSQLPIVNPQLWSEAEMLLEWARGARCDLPVRQLLAAHPVCACQFRLTRADAIINIPQHLEELAALGRAAYRRTLALFHVQLAHALDALSAREGVAQRVASRARALASTFAGGTLPSLFSPGDVRLITVALEETASPPPIRVRPPTENWGLLTRDELSARLQQWLDDLPHHTGFVEVVDGSKGA